MADQVRRVGLLKAVGGTPSLVAAIVDSVRFNAHIIETGTDSYRLRTTETRARHKPA